MGTEIKGSELSSGQSVPQVPLSKLSEQSREESFKRNQTSVADTVASADALDPSDYYGVGEVNITDGKGRKVSLQVPRIILKQIEAATQNSGQPREEQADLSADQQQALLIRLISALQDTYRENGWLSIRADELELGGLDPHKNKAEYEKRVALRGKILEAWDTKLTLLIEDDSARLAAQAEQIKAQAVGGEAAAKPASGTQRASLKEIDAEVDQIGTAIDGFETDLRAVYDKTNAILASAQSSGLLESQRTADSAIVAQKSAERPDLVEDPAPQQKAVTAPDAQKPARLEASSKGTAPADLQPCERVPLTKPLDHAEIEARDKEIASLRREVDELLQTSYLERAVTNNVSGPEDPAYPMQQSLSAIRDTIRFVMRTCNNAKTAGFGHAGLGFVTNGLAAVADSLRASPARALEKTPLPGADEQRIALVEEPRARQPEKSVPAAKSTHGENSMDSGIGKEAAKAPFAGLPLPPAISDSMSREQQINPAGRAALIDEIAVKPLDGETQTPPAAADVNNAFDVQAAPLVAPVAVIKKSLRDNFLKEIFDGDTAFAARRVNLESSRTQENFIKTRFTVEKQELMRRAAAFMRSGDISELVSYAGISPEQKAKLAIALRPNGLDTLESANDIMQTSAHKRDKRLAKASSDVREACEALHPFTLSSPALARK